MTTTPIWFKWKQPSKIMHDLTAWNDYILDRKILKYDAIWSAGHIKMLYKTGYMSFDDASLILDELKNIFHDAQEWNFDFGPEYEDCHSAIEDRLIRKLQDTGKRIHVWRSRNDQVLLATRLYMRSRLLQYLNSILDLLSTLEERIKRDGSIKISWYTHMQKAMPSSIGLFLQAFYEHWVELLERGMNLFEEMNICPFGWAAWFWVSLDTDKEYTAKILWFHRVVRNPINMNNSRGRYELRILYFLNEVAGLMDKFASDIMLWQTAEFWYWTLPAEFSTGSSIMPQKRNLDIVELLRWRSAKIYWASHEVQMLLTKLPSSYHRDFQYSKEPFMRADDEIWKMFEMMNLILEQLIFHKDTLENSVTPELFTTYAAFRLVAEWVPFREAYVQIAEQYKEWNFNHTEYRKDFEIIQKKFLDDSKILWELVKSLNQKISNNTLEIEKISDHIFTLN